MRVIVVDGQGGGIGKAVVTQLRRTHPDDKPWLPGADPYP